MAKLEQTVSGDFYELLRKIENGIQNSSMSASLEEFYSGSVVKTKI